MKKVIIFCALFILNFIAIQAFECDWFTLRGKVDIGPTIMDIDILESGKTVETLHMKGVKGDTTLVFWKGICLKGGFLAGEGHGKLSSYYVGVGQYLPVTDDLLLIPSVGIAYSYLHTKIDIEELQLFDLKEKFRSSSPYIALELCYKLTEKLTLMGMVQYAWCRTHTSIKPIVEDDKSKSQGPNYNLGIDYSLNDHWSLTAGVGYNITLTREKHGLRGKGTKIGVAYYF